MINDDEFQGSGIQYDEVEIIKTEIESENKDN